MYEYIVYITVYIHMHVLVHIRIHEGQMNATHGVFSSTRRNFYQFRGTYRRTFSFVNYWRMA